jgi:hypothetical protein
MTDKLKSLFDDIDKYVKDHPVSPDVVCDDFLEEKWQSPPIEIPQMSAQIHLQEHVIFEQNPQKRKYIAGKQLKTLAALIPELPPLGTDYHIVCAGGNKRIKRGAQPIGVSCFIEYIVSKFGDGCVVYISTWSTSRDHAFLLLELLDSGRIDKLHMLSDRSLGTRKPEITSILYHGIARFVGSRLAFFRNHSKIYCIQNKDGSQFCTITGSGNITWAPRAENYVISTSPDMYNHYVDNFFEPMFTHIDEQLNDQ